METHTGFWFQTVVLLAVLNSALAEVRYVVVGGNVDLRPPFTGVITNILWKHNGNLLAEWAKGEADLTYFIPFQSNTTLDITSGRLEVRNMSFAQAGLYTVDINNKVQDQRYDVKVIKEVPKPSIIIRPLTCSPASTNCTLSCGKEAKEAQPVTYSWKRDNEEWPQSMKDVLIIKTEVAYVKTFTCRMKNPVSEKESEPKDNPLFSEKELDDPNRVVRAVLISGLVILAVVAAGVVAYKKRAPIMNFINRFRSENVTPAGNGNPPPGSPSSGTEAGNTDALLHKKPDGDANPA